MPASTSGSRTKTTVICDETGSAQGLFGWAVKVNTNVLPNSDASGVNVKSGLDGSAGSS